MVPMSTAKIIVQLVCIYTSSGLSMVTENIQWTIKRTSKDLVELVLQMQKLLTFFSAKNISAYAIFYDQSFNETLTNDIFSFE